MPTPSIIILDIHDKKLMGLKNAIIQISHGKSINQS